MKSNLGVIYRNLQNSSLHFVFLQLERYKAICIVRSTEHNKLHDWHDWRLL